MVEVERFYLVDFWVLGSLPLALALDLIVGHPWRWADPVRWIDRLTGRAERGLRKLAARSAGRSRANRLAGLVLVILVVGLVASLVALSTDLLGMLGGPATLVGRALLIYGGLGIRRLAGDTLRVSEANSLFVARRDLAERFGRDASGLDAAAINRVCLEVIGEETNRSVVAPLFWVALLGPAGLWGYKAVDALIRKLGRVDPRGPDFGWAAARLDWLANLIPARVTWLLISLSAGLLNEDGRNALRIGWRDGRKGLIPDLAWGPAALAGALGVQLGGGSGSGGRSWLQPVLGDPIDPIDRRTVRRSVRIMLVTALNAAFLCLAVTVLLSG